MPKNRQSAVPVAPRSQLAYLMVSLAFMLLVVPILERRDHANWLNRVGITAVLITAAVATRRSRLLLVLGLAGAAIVAPISWVTLFYDRPWLFLINTLLAGLLFAAMAVLILVSVIRKHLATIDSIFGAIQRLLVVGTCVGRRILGD